MNASKPSVYPSLQRHRRKSSQLSPTSPTFPRRTLDRPARAIDPFSPVDGSSATATASESPSLDLSVSSPALQAIDFTQANHERTQQHDVKRMSIRFSEEDTRPKPTILGEIQRPLTSDAMDTKNSFAYALNNVQPLGPGGRASPMLNSGRFGEYTERYSQENPARHPASQSPSLRQDTISPVSVDRASPDEIGPAKSTTGKKSRLNLLNAMSLLARRRSSQNPNDGGGLTINTMHVPALPDNFDPSIRGTITHDFSAPRTRRTPSYGDSSQFEPPPRRGSAQTLDRPSPHLQLPSGPTPTSHSPMFKEHFQDDRPILRPGQTGYLHSIASQGPSSEQLEASMPAFAKRLPIRLPDQVPLEPKTAPPPPPPPVPPPVGAPDHDRPLTEELCSPTPPPPPPKRTPSPKLNLPPESVLPKHMTSTSSRFSFQLASQASSAQEKLLEEKHKQTQSTKRVSNLSKADNVDDLDYDDYDFDADDGLEERIPGVNAASDDFDGFGEDDGFGEVEEFAPNRSRIEQMTSLQRQSLQGFHFTPQSLTFSPTSTNHASQPTPRDVDGFAIGIADSKDLPEHIRDNIDQRPSSVLDDVKVPFLGGLGITTAEPTGAQQRTMQTPPQLQERTETFDDADLYFDDGEFGDDFQQASGDTFDEDVFDDESKIRDIPAENARKFDAARQAVGLDGEVRHAKTSNSASAGEKGAIDGVEGVSLRGGELSGTSRSSSMEQKPNARPGLTEVNLQAYHDALVTAAHEAAANGRFSRNVSFEESEDDDSQSQPGLISDESRFSHNYGASGIAEDDGFPFDDDPDDDLMIAEANAEALENDDDGFYGQEFGFYARAHSKESTELVNGGFFASRGQNGVKRSHSGRANFQEPSLTPITERSEWSTRNSVASLQIHGGIPGSTQPIPSPGIAQLRELDSPAYDEDMTLSALMKLRRGTFGGSSTSINSLVGQGHTGSSPLAHTGPHPFSPVDHSHRMGSSMHSLTTTSVGIPESEEEDDFGHDEPTLTQNTPMKKMSEPSPVTPSDQSVLSPTSDHGERKKFSHSRNSSGAESVVSYAREPGRWVLERRRTAEDGGVEVDREYIVEARI